MAAPRVVAELGRPETPEETADRKAAASAAYRSSKTFRNLIAALLVTVGIVAVIYLGVPRGTLADPEPVDVPAAASSASASVGHPLLVPETPSEWRANSARLEGSMWRVVYAWPSGYLRVAQGVDAPEGWAPRQLGNVSPSGSVTIAGIDWDEYVIPSGSRGDTVTYALSTPAGTDTVLIYGAMDAADAATAATGIADQIRSLREETP